MQCRRGDVVCATLQYIKNLKFGDYCRRKSYSQISTGVALLVSHAAHLAKLVRQNQYQRDDFYTVKIVLLVLSISLEVGIAVLLFIKERFDIDDEKQHKIMKIMNDVAVYLIFGSVLVHVFVSVFVEENHIPPHIMEVYRNYTRSQADVH